MPAAQTSWWGRSVTTIFGWASARLPGAAARSKARSTMDNLHSMASVVQQSSNAVVAVDLGLKVLWVNDGFSRTTGWQAQECIGQPINDLLRHPQSDPSARTALRQAAARGESYRIELINRRKDGSAVWMDVEIQATTDDHGRINGWVEVGVDISHRKRIEATLQQREHQLRVITDNLPARVSYWDSDLRCRFANQTFCNWFGRQREEMLEQVMSADVFGINLWQGMLPRVERVLAGEPQLFEQDESSAQGAPATWLVHYLPDFEPAGGRVQGLFALALDVTELKLARDSALQASQSKSQFVANMSHELRTPMNAVLGMLQLAQDTPLTEKQSNYLSRAEGAAQALLGILNDILDFSKVEAGKMALDPRPFELDALLRDLSVIFATGVRGKAVEFFYDLHPGLPQRLVADDMRLRQVLINLGGNAIKFTPKGQVTLSVRPVHRTPGEITLEFAVRDTGIGIAPDSLRRLFQDFGQAEASTTRRFGGTGLGLTICRKLVALMGGDLQVDSTPGQGSCFSFQVAMGLCDESDTPHAPAESRPVRVLQVDQSQQTRLVHQQMMHMLGWRVQVVNTTAEARRVLQAEPAAFDVVLVDSSGSNAAALEEAVSLMASLPAPIPRLLAIGTAEVHEQVTRLPPSLQGQVSGCLTRPLTPGMLAHAAEQACKYGATAAAAPPRQAPLSGLRVLVAEDNENNQLVARELLGAQGAQVVIACDGVEAVERMRCDHQFDVILMDWQMPRKDGLQACAEIRAMGFTKIPIIAMTANAMESDRHQCLAAGMNDHVAKPFVLKDLVARLLQHTSHAKDAPASPPQAVSTAAAAPKVSPSPGPVSRPLLDQSGALEQLGGSEALYEQLIPMFLSDLGQTLESVAALLHGDGDMATVVRQVHTLKGTAGTVGALQLADAAQAMERALKDRQHPQQALEWLRHCADRTIEQIEGRHGVGLPA